VAFLGASGSLLLIAVSAFAGVLFGARFLVSLWPGSLLLTLRRRLFLLTQPWVEPFEELLPVAEGGVDWTALGVVAVCFFLIRALAPWCLVAGFHLAAG
jgi:uncharacterized protein YggT (Ycf19 family)